MRPDNAALSNDGPSFYLQLDAMHSVQRKPPATPRSAQCR